MDVRNALRLGQVAGIEIRVHYTWLFIFALVAWSLAQGYFPASQPGLDATTYWVLGAVAALALFASVLVHELAHSLVARARGLGVRSITLFIFGGVSSLQEEAGEAKDEFLVAIVGPLTSFLLAGACWAAFAALGPGGMAIPDTPGVPGSPGTAGAPVAAAGSAPARAVFGYLAAVNLLLGLFNLLPGFPLDGGRVLRSIIWGVTGSLRRATQVASYAGQAIGFLLIFWGVSRMFGGAFLNGMWLAFVGWFLNGAAEAARRSQALTEDLRGVRVAALMDPQPATVGPDVTVEEFVFGQVLRRGRRAVLVTDAGRLLGIASITDAKEVPQPAWATTAVGEIMTPAPLKTVAPETDMSAALRLLVEGNLNQLPVLRGDQVVGLLTRADLLRALRLREELDVPFERAAARRRWPAAA